MIPFVILHVISYHEMSRTGKAIETESRLVVAWGWGTWWGMGVPANVHNFFLRVIKTF